MVPLCPTLKNKAIKSLEARMVVQMVRWIELMTLHHASHLYLNKCSSWYKKGNVKHTKEWAQLVD